MLLVDVRRVYYDLRSTSAISTVVALTSALCWTMVIACRLLLFIGR